MRKWNLKTWMTGITSVMRKWISIIDSLVFSTRSGINLIHFFFFTDLFIKHNVPNHFGLHIALNHFFALVLSAQFLIPNPPVRIPSSEQCGNVIQCKIRRNGFHWFYFPLFIIYNSGSEFWEPIVPIHHAMNEKRRKQWTLQWNFINSFNRNGCCLFCLFSFWFWRKSSPLFGLAWQYISHLWPSIKLNVESKIGYLQVKLKINPECLNDGKLKRNYFARMKNCSVSWIDISSSKMEEKR